jgi:prepilin-type N-terminal cleavage/methylation domain-containing protein
VKENTMVFTHRKIPSGNANRGFTLLELLIVCAIIAMLTAIALPNYQDALARSKVAKFKGDGHTLQTAIESYITDFQIYPFAELYPVKSTCGGGDVQDASSPSEGYLPRCLTTPAAYMNKLPSDPFKNNEDVGNCFPERRPYLYSSDSQNVRQFRQYFVSVMYAQLDGQYTFTTYNPSRAVWLIASPGPDGDRDFGTNKAGAQYSIPTRYDPTNGTISDGDLYMFGPGLGFD